MKNILVLGSRGMLGQMVTRFFTNDLGYNLIEYNHRFELESLSNHIQFFQNLRDTVVVNCIGRIKQKSSDPSSLFFTNSYLPSFLIYYLDESNLFVLPSTDCVFQGFNETPYRKMGFRDASDDYGISKILAEDVTLRAKNFIILRVSIIGPDSHSTAGLMSWFLNLNKSNAIDGYVNHMWNGITTLEWCKQLELCLRNNLYGLHQLGTNEPISKYHLLQLLNTQYNRNITINPVEHDVNLRRVLIPDRASRNIEVQIEEIRNYYEK